MNLDLENLKAIAHAGSLAHEVARIEAERPSWRKALAQSDSIGKQIQQMREMREMTEAGSAYAQTVKHLKALQPAAVAIHQQYKELLGVDALSTQTIGEWHQAQLAKQVSIHKMLEPLTDLRKSFLMDLPTQRLMKELADGHSIRDQLKAVLPDILGAGSVSKTLAQQVEDSRAHTKKLLQDLRVGSSIQKYLKDFEQINKQWRVPSEILGVVGSLKEIHEQFGKLALPTIDWGSAAALAKLLGQEGINEQLAHLGIEPDGSLNELSKTPDKGLLSRKQDHALALLSLLLAILMFVYQEYSSAQQQAKTEAFQAQVTINLKVQAQQIQSLGVLIEKALMQAAKEPEDRWVVRERTATVRSGPTHGAAVEGKLLPNEVVRASDRNGKWVEVEYYHWLYEEYRTGWILKKYAERVPANYANGSK